jgi:hypothetical protein
MSGILRKLISCPMRLGYLHTRLGENDAKQPDKRIKCAGAVILSPTSDQAGTLLWLLFVTALISSLGMQGCWLMVDSTTAGVCDDDEVRAGRRREGMLPVQGG